MKYKDKFCIHKRKNNKILCRYAKKIKKNRVAFVLDGKKGRSMKALHRYIPKNRIHIANYDIKNYISLKNITRYVRRGYANDVMKDLYNEKIYPNIFYMDYCCTIYGNSKINPIKDISYILKKSPNRKIVLAITNSLRIHSSRRSTNISESSESNQIINKLIKKSNYFILDSEEPYKYKRMLFNIFLLKKKY